MCRREEVADIAVQEIVASGKNIVIRQVKQTIAAQPKVTRRQLVSHDVEVDKRCVLVRVQFPVSVDERSDDISARIRETLATADQSKPVVVPAGGIKNLPYAEAFEQQWDFLHDIAGALDGRAHAGNTFLVFPLINSVEVRKSVFGVSDALQHARSTTDGVLSV